MSVLFCLTKPEARLRRYEQSATTPNDHVADYQDARVDCLQRALKLEREEKEAALRRVAELEAACDALRMLMDAEVAK